MNAVVDTARAWIGTPYVHQASVQGAGCDCLGLVRGVWRAVNGAEPEAIPAYTADWDEPQGLETLAAAASRHMRSVCGAWVPGQVLLFRMRGGAVAKHLGILSATDDTPAFIHAYTGHGVVESPLSQPWRRRVVARFDLQKG
ncbi:putative phage cell wall peptidase, NlpC/P60 family [Cognatiyoonia koreensis]|uniref:Putative phage cell wall peptidase, NlpC/P60 family n=1 Tax=Cognatiyoonia koreensis TaxID=364200 RepID=A0A1I0NSK5_9RHOB|nr:NlpC/P60 family protein [Cognatiyoonia koreensis]SEW04539.1 putative phage cell wall peptidase, NlpC/P60 family [Cognatiyoonia koreensis]